MKQVRLNNSIMMPFIGFGIFLIPQNEIEHAIMDTLEISYMLGIASSYFKEKKVNDAVRNSGAKREEFFIIMQTVGIESPLIDCTSPCSPYLKDSKKHRSFPMEYL